MGLFNIKIFCIFGSIPFAYRTFQPDHSTLDWHIARTNIADVGIKIIVFTLVANV